MKSLCDIQGVPFKPYLQEQFSIAFDLYLSVLSEVRRRVLQALGRDSPNWRLTNACPCCLYHVDGEPTLQFQLLCTVDGNNSLKRFARKEQVGELDESSSLAEFNSKERLDTRAARGDYYLSQDEVNRWSKESIQGMFEGVVDADEGNPCAERWKNLSEALTSKMWGIYDETGIFIALCRHSFVLLITDMVQSGELFVAMLLHRPIY